MTTCCEAFAEAMNSGTDNEGWGRLIRPDIVDPSDPQLPAPGCGYQMGCGLPAIKHCP